MPSGLGVFLVSRFIRRFTTPSEQLSILLIMGELSFVKGTHRMEIGIECF